MRIIMFQIQLTQKRLKSQIIIKEILLTLLILSIVTTLVTMAVRSVLAITTMPGNHSGSDSGAGNMTFVGNMSGGKSMMMPEVI